MGTGIFSMGTRAMFAAQTMLDTVGHNISNANTPGYSRQQVQLATENGMFTGAGFFGRGVKVVTITRSTNEFLVQEVNRNVSTASSDKARLDKLLQLEKVLPTGESGLGFAAGQLLNAFVDVANQPQDMAARQVVLSRAREWVSRVNTAGQQLVEVQRGVAMDVENTVKRINALTDEIAKANQAIASYKGVGHTPNDLMDKRDQLVRNLNELAQVTTVKADDGSLNVFLGGGQLLVLGNQTQDLSVIADATNSAYRRIALRNPVDGTDRELDQAQITGGALNGLLRFQDNDVEQTTSQLNAFVQSFADRLNEQQRLGLDAEGVIGTNLFSNTDTAAGIRLALSVPKGIAAASPLVATATVGNKGTATVDSFRMLQQSLPAGVTAPVSIQFVDDPASPSGLRYEVTANGAGTPYWTANWDPGEPITDGDPTPGVETASFELLIAGTPRGGSPGDSLSVSETVYFLGNNGNALAMLALRDDASFVSIDGASFATVTDAYSQMVGNLGVLVQSGKTSADISQTLATNSQQTLTGEVGVNLDEEAARLIQYQQSYQAAAKMLQVAQKVFDVLLDTAR